MKAYRQRNKERKAETDKAWQEANKERFTATMKEWRANNPEALRNISRNHRKAARLAGKHTAKEVQAIFDSQRGLCATCKSKLKKSGKNRYHVDHIHPLSKGGSNEKHNLQCLCPSCNLKKSAKHPLDWAKENGKLL